MKHDHYNITKRKEYSMNTKQSLMVHDAIRTFNSLYDKLYEGDIREE